MYAGIWDDRKSWFVHDFGGHCVFDQNITEYDRDKDIEVVWVDLAHDDSLSGFPATDSSTADLKNLTIPCLRPARNYKLAMMNAFHEECMEGIDEALYAEYMQIVCSCPCALCNMYLLLSPIKPFTLNVNTPLLTSWNSPL